MNIQTSVVTSPLNWAVSVCVHRLAQSGFLHAAAHCSHNNRACSHIQFIVAPTTVSRRNRTPRRWMKNPPPWGMPWRNWITIGHYQLQTAWLTYMICVWKYPVAVALWIQCEWTKWLKRVSLPKFNTVLCNVTGRQEFMPRSMMEKTNKQKLLLLLPG